MTDLRLIRLAIALGQHGSFARAAEALDLSQPSVSRGVAELERSLAVRRDPARRRSPDPRP
jgi:DNA-binding transcriptional LysR family regulator